jgi:hypothetical protein
MWLRGVSGRIESALAIGVGFRLAGIYLGPSAKASLKPTLGGVGVDGWKFTA